MKSTPIRSPYGTPSNTMMSPVSGIDSPFIHVRDYQKNLEFYSNENFTLKLLIYDLENKFRYFMKSHNVIDDVSKALIDQEKMIAQLKSEIGNATEYIASTPHNKNKMPPQSPSLKKQLNQILDENMYLKNLKEKSDLHPYSDISEYHSEILSNVSDSSDFMHLKEKMSNMQGLNHKLNNELVDLKAKMKDYVNENAELQKENIDLLQQVSDKSNEARNLIDQLNEANENIDSLNQKILILQNNQNNLDNMSKAIDDLEKLSTQNEELIYENNNLKQENERLMDENARLVDENERLGAENENCLGLVDKLNDSIDTIQDLQNRIAELEGSIQDLLLQFNVVDINDIIPKYQALIKDFNELKANNNNSNKNIQIIQELRAQNQALQNEIEKLRDLNISQEFTPKDHEDPNKKFQLYEQYLNLNKKLKKSNKWLNDINREVNSGAASSYPPRNADYDSPDTIRSPINNINKQIDNLFDENYEIINKNDYLYQTIADGLYSSIRSLRQELSKGDLIKVERDELKMLNDQINEENDNLKLELEKYRKLGRQSPNSEKKLFNENQRLKGLLDSEVEKNRMLYQNMNEISSFVEDSIHQFSDNFEDKFYECFNSLAGLLNKLTGFMNSQNINIKSDVEQLSKMASSMLKDMKLGSLMCLKGSKKSTSSSLSRNDMKKLSLLRQKWSDNSSPNNYSGLNDGNVFDSTSSSPLQHIRSPLFSSEYSQSSNDQSSQMIKLFQSLIHAIWIEFGNGMEEPRLNTEIMNSQNQHIIAKVIKLFSSSISILRKQIEELKLISHDDKNRMLSPAVIKLLEKYRIMVNNMTKQLRSEHQELLEVVLNSNEKAYDE
ncbi:hypothetical protein TRFO_03423 [Tritrichomonas foetus]|uniref:Uncharacterized protein n=1 Tax=Tritrichomonas foetus TaxID=1144522 RepID=A0A1J4KPI6_9EUKA|nr:hypothetical protein TRFO_03423 [Tritrichomonas foetus]|eukprot:OHT13018.1 hypothetical protein TRFO_03423 [Tritrichomonas foetus]